MSKALDADLKTVKFCCRVHERGRRQTAHELGADDNVPTGAVKGKARRVIVKCSLQDREIAIDPFRREQKIMGLMRQVGDVVR